MTAIELKGVSKKFRRHSERPPITTLKSYLLRDLWRHRKPTEGVNWALKDVDLKVEKGMTLGIIGRTGAAKRPLLKLIGRILRPDKGTVTVQGKVASIIELGAGFHPELTGRENVMINGIVLGLSKSEIKARLDEIVDFSELQDRIDDPVRTYSTGMYMRLGFSVAVHVDPDILLLDEVLAVGDAGFTRKCMGRMKHFKRMGRTIILVSHNLATIRTWCDEATWLHEGTLRMSRSPMDVVDAYLAAINGADAALAEPA